MVSITIANSYLSNILEIHMKISSFPPTNYSHIFVIHITTHHPPTFLDLSTKPGVNAELTYIL